MSVLLISELTISQKEQVRSLLDTCLTFEPVTIEFPLDGADLYALYEHDKQICSAAAFTKEDDTTYECCAYTAPNFRDHGFFSMILDAAIDELPEDTEFMFFTDHKSQDTLKVLAAYEAECVMEEHMMELDTASLEQWILAHPSIDQSNLQMEETSPEGTKTFRYQNLFGSVKISVFLSYYYLYGLEIHENQRGKGLGTLLLNQVLKDLYEYKPMPVRLQVSGDNLPALNLYKKTGFHITETLSCYLY